MHISETPHRPNTILTKCSNMNEECHKRDGMNGSSEGGIKEEPSKNSHVPGGRLKFYKDGKFILELERSREGERVSWVSVPRKTFWPPPGTASSGTRQETASLSASDDNSSIQSSPWQRDHSWKQTTPRRNLGKPLTFLYWCPKSKRHLYAASKHSRKRRQPYSTTESTSPKVTRTKKQTLLFIVQRLIDRNVARTPPPKIETVVSPRKRFLREMERDKPPLEDTSNQKRSRSKTVHKTSPKHHVNGTHVPATQAQSVAPPVATSSGTSAHTSPSSVEDVKPSPVRNSSYSITSLLADDRIRRSPNNSPSHVAPRYATPTTDDRWFSESVDRLRCIELSQVDKRAYSSYPYLPPYMYPYALPPYYNPSVYNRGYAMPPPMYHTPQSAPIPPPVRHDCPSSSWSPRSYPPREGVVEEHPVVKEENISDMPLNLSKHGGG